MVITVGPDLEAALSDLARKQGVAAEVLALQALRERFLAPIGEPTSGCLGAAPAGRSHGLWGISVQRGR